MNMRFFCVYIMFLELLCSNSWWNISIWLCWKFRFKNLAPSNTGQVSPCVTQFQSFSRSHGRFFLSHGFTNSKWIYSQAHNFLRKQTRQHNPPSKNIAALSSTYKIMNNSVIFDSKTTTRNSRGNSCPVNYQKFYEMKHQSNKKCSFRG